MRLYKLIFINLFFFINCAANVDDKLEDFNSAESKKSLKDSPSQQFSAGNSQEKDLFQGVQFFMDGMLFMDQGDYARAIIEFQESIEAGSSSAEVYFNMSEAYWMLQKYDKSISLSKKAILLDDNALDYKISLGKKYIALNKFELSLEIFTKISKIDPENADILFIIGDLKSELNDIDGALLYYQEAYNINNDLILALEIAAQLAFNSNHRDLSKIFKKLLLAKPSNSEYLRGYLESIKGNNLEDLTALLKIEEMKNNPYYNNLYNQIALEFLRQGEYQSAEKFLNDSLSKKENDRFALYYLSIVYREISRNDLALKISRKHIDYYPNDKEGYINTVLSLFALQRFEEVIEELNIAISLFPEDFEINYFLGLAHYSSKNFKEAEEFYFQSLKIDNQSIAAMHGLAMTYDQNQKWDKSDELYTKLISINNQDAQAYNNFAYSLVERDQDLEYALILAKKAIQINPEVSAYLDTIGWIYYKLSKFEIAKDYISKALLYDDTSAVILEHYGDVLISLNEIDEALVFYNKALKLDESNNTLKTKIASYETE